MTPQVASKVKQTAKFTKKPIIIAEVASFHKPLAKSKAKWLKQGYLNTYRRFPKVKGILYLDAALGATARPTPRLAAGTAPQRLGHERLPLLATDQATFQGKIR